MQKSILVVFFLACDFLLIVDFSLNLSDDNMEYLSSPLKSELDCLLIFVPKFKIFYKPIGEHMFTVLLPMGLMSIADFVHRRGYKVQILHLGLEKINNQKFSLEQYLAKVNPKVIGLSLHWHYQCYDTIEIVKEIKLFNSNIFIVLGGLTASYFHEEILREFNFIDGVIRGDAEEPFLKLLKEISAGNRDFSNVPNLTWRDDRIVKINEITYVVQQEDLDSFNFTNFNLLKDYQLYIKMQDMRGGRWLFKGINKKILDKFGTPAYFPLLIHKGCFTNCSYCGGSRLSQKIISARDSISIRSVEKVVDSIKEAQRYGYKEIYTSYLPFNNHHDYFEKLFETIKKEKIKMNYHLECWALPSKEIIYMFKEICLEPSKSCIAISPESGSEHIRRLNKGYYYSNDELIETLVTITSLNIAAVLYFSIGLPFETIKDANDTIHFQRLLKKKFGDSITISTVNPVIEPVSPMFIEPGKYGIVKTRFFFKDFVKASKDTNKSGFLTSELGYFKRDFCELKRFECLSEEEAFRKELQRIICKSSCRLADFILSNFPKANSVFARKLVLLGSRPACNILYFFWRLSVFFEKLKCVTKVE